MQITQTVLDTWSDLDRVEVRSPSRKGGTQPIARLGMTLRAFVFDAHTPEVRLRLIEALAHYRGLVGDHLRHRVLDGQHWAAYRARWDIAASYQKQILDPNDTFAVYVMSGDGPADRDENEPQTYSARIVGCDYLEQRRSPGIFYCHLPFMWMAEPGNSFVALVRRVLEILQPIYASAGIGLTVPVSSAIFLNDLWPHSRALIPVAQKWIGAELTDHGFYLDVASGYYSVNWLTAVGDEWLQRLGGKAAVRERLQLPGFECWDSPGGLLIRAGEFPQLGDTEHGQGIPEYSALDAVLRPLRIAHYRTSMLAPGPHGRLPPGREKYQQVLDAYLRRFEVLTPPLETPVVYSYR
jgi:hypothetical protein